MLFKTYLRLLFVSIICVSSSYARISTVDTSSPESQYNTAMKHYKSGNYKESYEIYSKLYLSKLSDSKMNFFFGRSAFEVGEYKMALAAFERVSMLDPKNIRNRLEMARTLYMLKMYDEASLEFQAVLEYPILPNNVRTKVELYLSNIKKMDRKSYFTGMLDFSVLYDSNVNLGSYHDTYTLPDFGTFSTVNADGDVGAELLGDITNIYDIGDKNGFSIRNKAVIYSKMYASEDDYNMNFFSYQPGVLYQQKDYIAELNLGYDQMWLKNESYHQSFMIQPKLTYRHQMGVNSLIYLKYQKRDFIDTNDRDANHYEISYGLQKNIMKSSYLIGTLTAIKESGLEDTRIDVSYLEYQLRVNYGIQITNEIGFSASAEMRQKEYDDYSSLFANTREDGSIFASAKVDKKIFDSTFANIKVSYSDNDSNQNIYSYKKYVIQLGVNARF